jgi:hypothetical protein
MAKMFPERLPEHISNDPSRDAERAVYEALRLLPDPYTIFYSVAWLSRRADSGAKDGEADFVVAHPDLGILVLEVKGGTIAFDADTGEWTTRTRHGNLHVIKDPVAQARTSKHELRRKLQDLPNWPASFLSMGHVVVFPDTTVSNQWFRPDLPKDIIWDRTSLANLEKAIQNVFAFFYRDEGQSGRLGPDRLRITIDLLARSFQLRTPLGEELKEQDKQLLELTEHQMRVLDMLSFQRNVAIHGCAGSGKTMLAFEKARRLAAEGFDVLLTCFNANLANYLTKYASERISVFHFHALCEHLIKEAELRAIPPQDRAQYYGQFLPDLMLEAVDTLGPQYDAIIVDEGQDFKGNWLLALRQLLHDPQNGVMYTFFDNNQNLYRGTVEMSGLAGNSPIVLNENCRNTQQIHSLVAKYHHHGAALKALGPLGIAPELQSYSTSGEMLDTLGRALHRLVDEESVEPKDIVILTPRAEVRSALKDNVSVGRFALTRKNRRVPNQILVTTIHQFKGLERRVVILAELDETAHPDKNLILYVGCSRARVHLLLLHDHNFVI